MTTLPCTMDDAHVSISVGAAIRALIDLMVDGQILEERHRIAAEVLVASFFMPLLAREDRIAAYLNRSRNRVRTIGRRLRAAGIWQGISLTEDCYDMLMDKDALGASISISLLAGVGIRQFFAERGDDGVLRFSLTRPHTQTTVEMDQCKKCGTSRQYVEGGACVECQRRYMRGYIGRPTPGFDDKNDKL